MGKECSCRKAGESGAMQAHAAAKQNDYVAKQSRSQRPGPGPMTATEMTLSGAFAPDNSAAANAARTQVHIDSNTKNQAKYKGVSSRISQNAIDRANQNAYVDPAALDTRIGQREQFSRDQSTVMSGNLFGDMHAYKDKMPDYQMPEAQKEIEVPDFQELYDKYSNFDGDKDKDDK